MAWQAKGKRPVEFLRPTAGGVRIAHTRSIDLLTVPGASPVWLLSGNSMKQLIIMLMLATLANVVQQSSPAADVSDNAQILAAHERVLQAHRQNDVDMLMEDTAEDYILVTNGEVIYPTVEERQLRFSEYFAITTFDKYEDSISPVVKVSADGTLAWLVARVIVEATQDVGGQDEQLAFVSAWIELYEKRNGRWIQTGNVSNFKP